MSAFLTTFQDERRNERDIRYQAERGRRRRDDPRHFSCVDHRLGDPHLPVPAFQYSVRLDEGDTARWRLPVRVEVFLWLQPVLAAFVAADFLRPHSWRVSARARRRRRVPSAEGYLDRLHQARDRIARRQDPGRRRRRLDQRRAGETRTHRRLYRDRGDRARYAGQALERHAAKRRHVRDARSGR